MADTKTFPSPILFIGVAHLLPALTSKGQLGVAYQLLNTDSQVGLQALRDPSPAG